MEPITSSTCTALLVGSASTRWIVPENSLTEMSCLPVTLAPVRSIVEPAWEKAKAVAPAGTGTAGAGALVFASALPLVGLLSQAESTRATRRQAGAIRFMADAFSWKHH